MTSISLSCVIFCVTLLLAVGWGCGQDLGLSKGNSEVQNDANMNYEKILNFWNKHKKEVNYRDKHREAVLVVGNTGAGKTTLVSALVGRKLSVTLTTTNSMIVDEENRIGTDPSSKTLLPEVMIDNKRNVTYFDCTGFQDNRDVEYELSSLYFKNILMHHIDRMKLILVINYESLATTGSKTDLHDLFDHVGEYIKNISKFRNGIALVVTKIENTYNESNGGGFNFLDDNQSVVNTIVGFLESKKNIYRDEIKNREKYQLIENLIDLLLQKKNNSYTRIGIFHKPTNQGLLTENPKMKNDIQRIAEMIMDNLDYVEKQQDDFDIPMSTLLKTTVNQIVGNIINTLVDRLHKIGNETLTRYLQMERQYSDISFLRKEISYAHHLLSAMHNTKKPKQLFEEFLNMANRINISVSLSNVDISNDIEALQFFTIISNDNENNQMRHLKNSIKNFTDSMKNLNNFYEYLTHLEKSLATYKSQELKNDQRIKNILATYANSTIKVVQDIPDLENLADELDRDVIYQNIKPFELNRSQLKHLKAIFSAFTLELEFSCSSSTKTLTVKGYNIKISDVMKLYCWEQAQNIEIFALNKVFIDETINKIGAQQLLIFAPTWEVFENQKIILDGKEGEPHKKAIARTAFSNLDDGVRGLPGLPGSPAGNFYGIGNQFINLEKLEIHANGGKGGPGQQGGNGANGIVGEELPKSFFEIDQTPLAAKNYFNDNHYVYTFVRINEVAHGGEGDYLAEHTDLVEVLGKPATKPTTGGVGGAGGKGGNPGKVIINGLGKSVTVKTFNNSGPTGLMGEGGHGGKGTFDGSTVKFKFRYGSKFMNIGWFNEYSNISRSRGAPVAAGKDGIPGVNENNQMDPTPMTPMSIHYAINSFKSFVRRNLFENVKESELKTFIYEIENNSQIKAQYNTFAFVEEIKGLENEFLELRNKINFVPFYGSFLNRVEEYAKSERVLENKKVLGYIHTAALTKLITLNKKRGGKTVVNLPKYLNIIARNINKIDQSHHLQIVQKYQDDYKHSLNKKIQEAKNFIQNTIEPEIDLLWDQCESQMKAIIDEIIEKRNLTIDTRASLVKAKAEVRKIILLRAALSPLKFAAIILSFIGPVGAGIGVAIASATIITEGIVTDKISSQGANKINSLDPNLKLMSRVTEVVNNKHQLATEKLNEAMTKLKEYEQQLSVSDKGQKRQIKTLKTQLQEATFRKTTGYSQSAQKLKDIEDISKKMLTFTNSEKTILEKRKEEEIKIQTFQTEKRYEKRLRLLNDAQSILNGVEIAYSFSRKLANDEGMINNINNQISDCIQELRVLEKMENQIHDIILPDLQYIEDTINAVIRSVNGSSHAKLDLTKWNIRTTLKDIKSLVQKFTQKMSFEIQSNLQRYIDKIDEGFSIFIDIYDRIDSYSDSVKQAKYIAYIESASMDNIQVNDTELSKAVNDLKLMIYSNLLTEQYEIALHAFKQHYFPYAAYALEKFQLPSDMKLNDTETLRSNIIDKIDEMKNYIDSSDAGLSTYSKYTHRNHVFNSDNTGFSPFYVWKYDTIKDEVRRLLNGSEIVIKADISKAPSYNAVKYNDIGINFKFNNKTLQSSFTSVLKNFKLTMTMVGNNYYRCGERYYFISFDDDVTISYTLQQDGNKNWFNPNEVYSLIHDNHAFISPYGMWSIKLQRINELITFNHLNVFTNATIDLELVGIGSCIEQNANFNFDICSEYLDAFYDVENIVKVFF